jgi:hypothetical protein
MAKIHNDTLYQSIEIDIRELSDIIAKFANKNVDNPIILPRYINVSNGVFNGTTLTVQYNINFADIRRNNPGVGSSFDEHYDSEVQNDNF